MIKEKLVETFLRLRWGDGVFPELLFRLNPLRVLNLPPTNRSILREGLYVSRWSLMIFLVFVSQFSAGVLLRVPSQTSHIRF